MQNNAPNNSEESKNIQNENLSWQQLKKNIEPPAIINQNNNQLGLENSYKATAANNHDQSNQNSIIPPQNNQAINGFEFKGNPTQIAQTNQVNHDYKEQQEYIKEIKNTISNITKELAENANRIKELHDNIFDLAKSMNGVNNNLNIVDHKLTTLNSALNDISLDVKNLKKYLQEEDLDLNSNLRTSEKDLFSNNIEYVIHAVIPGRAWLKSSTGQIITVTEGDPIGDYGKVASIDATNNIVRTSSGVIFK